MSWIESAVSLYMRGLGSQGAMQRDRQLEEYVSFLLERAAHFRIYKNVDLNATLPDGIQQEDEPGLCIDSSYDPRFASHENPKDLRVAIMSFLEPGLEVDHLSFAVCADDGVFDLNNFEDSVRIVREYADHYIPWYHFGDDVDEATEVARLVYRAGQLEIQKRKHAAQN